MRWINECAESDIFADFVKSYYIQGEDEYWLPHYMGNWIESNGHGLMRLKNDNTCKISLHSDFKSLCYICKIHYSMGFSDG